MYYIAGGDGMSGSGNYFVYATGGGCSDVLLVWYKKVGESYAITTIERMEDWNGKATELYSDSL